MSEQEPYEYGVLMTRTAEVHRTGMSEQEAQDWVREWVTDGGRVGAFAVIRRAVGEWETR